MFERDLDSKTKAEYRLSRRTEGQQEMAGSPLPYDPLARVTGRVGNVGSINAHAAVLNRATASRPSQARHALLQLQRQYGNRYVQRVVELARQDESDAEVAPEVEQAIQRARGHGQALDSGVHTQMKSAFGVDFSGVRVHTGSEADGLNRALSARAFTTGRDIFFRQGEYNPGSSGGRELLAHELTHVVQQAGGEVQYKLALGKPGDKYEQEADQVAQAIMQQEQATPTKAPERLLYRQVIGEKSSQTQLMVQRQVVEMPEEVITVSAGRRARLLKSAGWQQKDIIVTLRDFLGEPLRGHMVFAEFKAPGVGLVTEGGEVRGGSIMWSDVWLQPVGTVRLMAVRIGTPAVVPEGVTIYTRPARGPLKFEAVQESREVTVTATTSEEAAIKAGVKGTAGVDFKVFSLGGEASTEAERRRGSSVALSWKVIMPTATFKVNQIE